LLFPNIQKALQFKETFQNMFRSDELTDLNSQEISDTRHY